MENNCFDQYFTDFGFAATTGMTREVFGNIPESSQRLFYLLAVLSLIGFALGTYRRIRYWRMGKGDCTIPSFRVLLGRLTGEILNQKRVLGRKTAGIAHVLLFSGFLILGLGTTLIGIEHWSADILGRPPDQPVFHFGLYYIIYEIVLDTFGIALLSGCTLFFIRRVNRPSSLGHNLTDWWVLVMILVIGLSGYLVEALRILHNPSPADAFSFVGRAGALALQTLGLERVTAGRLHFQIWWGHAVLSFVFIAAFPFTRLFHAIAGSVNILLHEKDLGTMVPITLEELEESGKTGVENVNDMTVRQLIELDSCVSCGRCEEACPAYDAGKPLSPRILVQDIRKILPTAYSIYQTGKRSGESQKTLAGDIIREETIWACTTCNACVSICPLNVNPLGMITDLRRFLIGEGKLRGAASNALQKIQRSGNPWGMPQQERFQWADGLDVPTVKENPDFEVLYWVGCAASYDRRVQKIARAMVKLFRIAGINYAVLGKEEKCNGETCRRMGDEFAFQEAANQNGEVFSRYGVRKLVTHCPHCLNSFRKDYPQFGDTFEVVHHSEFLDELIQNGTLQYKQEENEGEGISLAYHDPCYLSRVNGMTLSPRRLLASGTSSELQELPRNREQTACCGAGGGDGCGSTTLRSKGSAERAVRK